MNDELIGLWRLVSAKFENLESAQVEDVYGPDPLGFMLIAPGGRMMLIISSREQHRGNDPAAYFASMMAYSGTYRVDGDKWITDVDLSWFPAWVGSQQERFFSIVDADLHIRSAPVLMPSDIRRQVRAVLVYRREDPLVHP